MFECNLCYRQFEKQQELAIHQKYFHGITHNGQQAQKVASGACPDCGSTLFFQEGCVKCQSCGFSNC